MSEKPNYIGQRVELPGKDTTGTIAFIGTTQFSHGKWIGVVLDEKKGKNNGTVQGKSYFQCEDGYGLFIRPSQMTVLDDGGGDTLVPTTPKATLASAVTTPSSEKPKSSIKRKVEPTSLRRKPIGNQVPQKPDRLRLPLVTAPKVSTPKGEKEDKSPRETPRQEVKKAASFIEDKGFRQETVGLTGSSLSVSSYGSLAHDNAHASAAELHSDTSSPVLQTGFMETITPQYTPGTPSGTLHTLEEKANAFHQQHEIENLKAEIKDLNEKLETLKIKRSQDKEKLKDGEKMKLQIEQLLEFKSRIMDSQAQLQKELQKAKQDAKEAIEAKERHIEETEELMENVEMLTLDKEMAEEKAEALQVELELMKEKNEELTLDLEILKAEENEDSTKLAGRASSVQVKQLEQQSARLHETLVRMRDMAATDKHELQKLQKEMESKKSEVLELSRSKEIYSSKVNELEETISDLQEQVDAALGAEEMVETLTDRNLNLEERIVELMETVADLEAINDMNDQLQEDTREVELELREELDMTNAKLREVKREKEAANEMIVDQDKTIKKFRDLVQKMQEQNMNLRNSLEKETNKPVGTPSEVIDFKKMFTETKAHSKAIDFELRQLEVQQANQHVTYLTQYLPDTFMSRGGDHDSVLILLLFHRIIWKADIITTALREQFQPPEAITRSAVLKSHTVDQYSFCCRMLQMLYMLQAILRQYHHVLKTCSVDVFLKMGTLYPEMAAHEKTLDFFIDLLRKDQLDENVPVDNLERTVTYFQTMYPAHLGGEKLDQTIYLTDVSKAINSAAEAISTESATIEALLPPPEGSSEVTQLLTYLKSSCQEISNYSKRIKRRIPQDGSAGPLTFPEDIQDTLTKSMSYMFNATRSLRYVSKSSMQQTALIGDIEGVIPSDKVKEFIHQATDLMYGSEDQGPESLKISLNKTQEEIFKIADRMEKGEYDFDGTQEKEAIPPLSLRAEAIKNELRDTEHLKYKLENKEQDIKELKLSLKQKNEELSQMTVRRDMAEKKLSTATRDSDITIEKLQRKLDDALMVLRRKEKEYEETMDQLQNDIESLESEKGELREKLKTLNKKSLYEALTKSSSLITSGMSPSSPTTPGTNISFEVTGASSSSSMVVKDSPLLLQQISDLRQALCHASTVRYSAINTDMHQKLASLKPLHVTKLDLKSEEKRDLNKEERKVEHETKRLNQLTEMTNKLRKELMEMMAGVEVVDLTKLHSGMTPVTQSLSPMQHLIAHKNKIANLQNKISSLQNEVTRIVAERKPGGSIQTSFASFPSPQLIKAMSERETVKIGRVIVQGSPGSTQEVVPVVLQPEQLKALHLRLIN